MSHLFGWARRTDKFPDIFYKFVVDLMIYQSHYLLVNPIQNQTQAAHKARQIVGA